ncbi:precorrin-6y C5,15-methyltransferase (decarboxylating) subunit CbiE [Phytohabitans sp. ZYX-F-186]|uniref:Precorrin-6y C5,15-methyltransferase (Decarboxylating) subunit CbiE n=1 Tax=Phytohabitans maris TaxID=3071409 RepID=A0ABU0ZRQ0_9ACTN|nr:precorrin-6y C5,15-methyltransferase (decarboxylating) subunit CbiE [Phytohabitans sp. ZYX-F-186]MDQ7909701.1 precorrin-6y C5,15-methyltransferase (decarboxylating) subunit CbiE [Phytohabitans sp. ZYX-F-186]
MPDVHVVGIGADGWPGLAATAQSRLVEADVLFGSRRQLALLPGAVRGERLPWPSPLMPALPGLLDAHRGRRVCVLASGDPMHHGIGAAILRILGPGRVAVLPHASSMSLACARLGWAMEEVEVVGLVGRPVQHLHPYLTPGRRLLVLGAGAATVAGILSTRGYEGSRLTVLEQLGGPGERIRHGSAASPWPAGDQLAIVAVECAGGPALPAVPGLPDDAYVHDGQLTKREVRAVTLARLAPVPGQLLWDVGAGAGSVAVEWMRGHRSCRAVAVESDPTRAARIRENALALGVPDLSIVEGRAPAALAALPGPDAVFVGGGVTEPGLLEACWAALSPGGRLVANAVTLESEAVLAAWHATVGGDLTRIEVSRAGAVGGFTAWRPALPVVQWAAVRS